MPLSFRNVIDTNQLADALTTGDYSKVVKKKNQNLAKYVKGYAKDSAIEALANTIDPNMNLGLFKQAFGLENKQLDGYDPFHTSDAKKEEFWFDNVNTSNDYPKVDGKEIQKKYDEDTNTFKRGLYNQGDDFWYEDPFYPTFEIYFDDNSPFFAGNDNLGETISNNSLKYFIQRYNSIDSDGYLNRFEIWSEFKKVFFKIFEKSTEQGKNRDEIKKNYYISKLEGLDNLSKKMINFGEDKITITLNEDVSMFSYYISELYNNLIYSYRNQRYMFPENLLRFDMVIQINEIRNFQLPESSNKSGTFTPIDKNNISNKYIKNVISPQSKIIYVLHDCTFNFFESKNIGNEIEKGGFSNPSYAPQSLSFNIFYKSVTRHSSFPLINNSFSIDAWESSLFTDNNPEDGTNKKYFNDLDKIKNDSAPIKKSFTNQLLSKGLQTVVNQAANYTDNHEAKLREIRGSAVNGLLNQFRSTTNINKIEPDNIYAADFNNRASVKNAGKQVASGLLNGLENGIRNTTNF